MTDRPWRVYGASVQGTSHRADGTPCQDAHGYRVLADGTSILAVADGAGSASHSQHGSARAANEAVLSLTRRLDDNRPRDDDDGWENLLRDAFADARASLVAYAAEHDLPLQSLATTLACAVVTGPLCIVGQIGDGATVVETAAGTLHTVARPVRGEYANETHFLSQENALDLVQLSRGPANPTAIALTTDGLLRLAVRLPSYDPHEPFFRPVLGYVARLGADVDEQAVNDRLAAFLDSERINVRTDDDKTLVIASRGAVPVTTSEADAGAV
jgi:hypothetical protein